MKKVNYPARIRGTILPGKNSGFITFITLMISLLPYERILHLRSIFSGSDFLAWLERPNREVDDSSPMELINAGHADIVADLVEDMLLGVPA